jgi:hypothetical protein
MQKRLAALAAGGWNRVGFVTRIVLAGLAVSGAAAVFGAPADLARGLAWLQSQLQAQGQLTVESKVASQQQARCETASTLLKLAGSSPQVAALVAALEEPAADAATESLACWQQLRQQLGQTLLTSAVETRRVGQQGYAPFDNFGVATALDTGWALAAQLQNLSGADKANALSWLQTSQGTDGSFSLNSGASVLSTAVILRALKDESSRNSVAAAVATKAANYLLAQRDSQGRWLADTATTALVYEAVQPYTGSDPGIASAASAYLLAQQQTDGSWAGDPYVTALALRALALTSVTPVDPTGAGNAATVRGVITGSAGQLLSAATITVTPAAGPAMTAVSDINGQFVMQGIAPGGASLSAALSGYQTATATANLTIGTTAIFSPTLYPNGATITSGGRINGNVVAFGSNAPVPAAAVLATPASGAAVIATADSAGHFDMAVPPSSIALSITSNGYAPYAQQVIIANGSVMNLGSLPLQPARQASTVRGTVYDFSGQPIAGATVQVGGQAISATSNSAGAYSLAGITGTSITVQAGANGYVPQSQTLSAAQPTDLVQDFSLPATGAGYLTLSNLQASATSLGLRQDLTATVLVSNNSSQAASAGMAMDVLDPNGLKIASVQATDAIGNSLPLNLAAGQASTAYFKWNSGSFPVGAYQLLARLLVTGSVSTQNPAGVVLGSIGASVNVQSSSHFTGSVIANPPVLQAAPNQTVALSAVIQNDGNAPLAAQSYQLVVIDTASNQTVYTQSVNGDALAVAQLQPVTFASWTPSTGGNFKVQVTSPSTPGSALVTALYVGAAGQAAWTVDKPVVPAGTQTVRGTINLAGQNTVNGAIQDPLASLVQQALVKAVNFGDSYSLNHTRSDKCFACHIQAQSLAGGERSLKYFQPASALTRSVLVTAISQNIFNPTDTNLGTPGPTNDAALIMNGGFPSGPQQATSYLGLWGLSQWHDPAAVNYTRGRVARYLLGQQAADGSWAPDALFTPSWWTTKSPLTALNLASLASVKSELLKQPSTFTGKTLVQVPVTGLQSSVWRLAADAAGNLYAAGNPGVWKIPVNGGAATQVSTTYANAVVPLPDGRLLIGNTQGMYLQQLNGSTTNLLPGAPVSDLTPLPDGTFLMATPWWDPGNNLYKVTTTGGITAFYSNPVIQGKSATTAMPDGSVMIANGTNFTASRFGPDGTLQVSPLPGIPLAANTSNQAQGITLRPYLDGMVLTTEHGLFFYDKNWVGRRWTHEFVYGPASTPDGRLFVNYAGGVYEVKDKPIDAPGLAAQVDTGINNASNWLKAGAGVDSSSNVDLAFQLMGLANARAYFRGTARANEFDASIQSVGATLQGRQRADGSWVWKQGTNTVSDPMVTAMVGVALDALNPSPNSPQVRNAVQYLLAAQQPDGTWKSPNFNFATPQIPSTWVEIWLPMMLDRLGHLDVSLSVTFPANVAMANPTQAPVTSTPGSDGSSTYQWNFTTDSSSPAQLGFDLTLANMQVDEVRAVAQQANLLFRNSFTGGTVTSVVTVPTVSVNTNLSETVSTDKTAYTEADQALFTAQVSNAGTAVRSGQVRFSVLDAGGQLVQSLPLTPMISVPGGAGTTSVAAWQAGGVLAGSYQLKSELLSPTGLLYATATTSFVVSPSQQQASSTRVMTDRTSYSAAQLVQVSSRVANLTSNLVEENLSAVTVVRNAGGQSVFSQTEAIAQLAPGGQRQYGYGIAASGMLVGSYSASLQLLDAQAVVLSQSTVTFTVLGADQTGVGLTGQLQAMPSVVLIGQPVALSLSATNRGNTALANVPVTLRIIDPQSGVVVTSFSGTVASWAQAASQSLAWNWTAQGLDGQTVVAAASASIGGRDIALGQANIRLVGVPKLTATPAQLQFTPVYVGQGTAGQTTTVASIGSAVASTVTFSLAGTNASQFVLPQGGCTQSASLPVGATCTLTVSYRPTAAGQHSAEVHIGYAGASDLVVQLSGQAMPVLLAGSVASAPAEVAVGEPTSLTWSVSNSASISVTASLTLGLNDAAGHSVASWPIQTAVAAGATRAGNQSYTPDLNAQTLSVLLSQSVAGASTVIATSTLVVTEIPVKVDPGAQVGREARILVLVSCKKSGHEDDEGAADDAGCVAQRSAGIATYLNTLGILNKVVSTPDAFKQELCCGTYNTYWLSGGAAKLQADLVGQLREAIWRGESLISDGVHDSRNQLLDPVDGIAQHGKLPVSNQTISIPVGSIYTPGSLPTLGRPLKVDLLGQAKAQAWFTQMPGNQAATPAIVSNRYGNGNSLLFAFDLAAMVTADPQATSAPLRDLMTVTASLSANGSQTLTIGALTVLSMGVSNQGTRASAVEVRASLPAGLVYDSAGIAPTQVNQQGANAGTVSWTISLDPLQSRTLVWRVMAKQAGVFTLPVSFYSVPQRAGEIQRLLDTRSFTLTVQDPAQLVQDPPAKVQALQPSAANDKNAKAKALAAANLAASLHAQGRYLDAITQWLAAADALITITSVDTTAARDAVAKALEASTDALCALPAGAGNGEKKDD